MTRRWIDTARGEAIPAITAILAWIALSLSGCDHKPASKAAAPYDPSLKEKELQLNPEQPKNGDTGDDNSKRTLNLGVVSNSFQNRMKRLSSIANYVAARMHGVGIHLVKIHIVKTNAEMIQALRDGRIDWVDESLFSSMKFAEEAGVVPFLIRAKGGVQFYHSVVLVRRDSEAKRLEDLVGKTIAFEDSGSTSGCLLPIAELKARKLRLIKLKSAEEKAPADAIGYRFSGSELNSALWVHRKLAQAAALSNLDLQNPLDVPPAVRKELRILHRTRNVPRMLELVRKDLPAPIRDRLKQVLLNAHKTEEGRAALKRWKKTSRLYPLNTKPEDYLKPFRELYRTVAEFMSHE